MKKYYRIISIVLFLSFLLINNVLAFSKTTDYDEKIISLPSTINNGEGKLTISKDVLDYKLYYQVVQINNIDEIQKYISEKNNELKEEQEKLNNLSQEVKNLLKEYNNKIKEYNKYSSANLDDEKLKKAETEFDKAKTMYENKINEYNEAFDNYNKEAKTASNSFFDKVTLYNEEKWIESTDGNFKIDTDLFSNDKAYALWIKLITSDNNEIYDMNIYKIEGNDLTKSGALIDFTNDTNNKKKDNNNNDDNKSSSHYLVIIIAGIVISVISLLIIIKNKKEYKQI